MRVWAPLVVAAALAGTWLPGHAATAAPAPAFTTRGADIMHGGVRFTVSGGVNAFHVFARGDDTDYASMRGWNVAVVREFVGEADVNPIDGAPVKSPSGAWLHPLKAIAADNRRHGMVTVFCPFGWLGATPGAGAGVGGTSATATASMLTGLEPSTQPWLPAFKARMREWAAAFRDEPDVWIETWNEPHPWTAAGPAADTRWLADADGLVSNLRAVPGFANIVLAPGGAQGQDEAPLLTRGAELMARHGNVVFDLHAYERWLTPPAGAGEAGAGARLDRLRAAGLPVMFGECGPVNAGGVMPVAPFLAAARRSGAPVLGWCWKRDAGDRASLRDGAGNPNDRANGGWGTAFRRHLAERATGNAGLPYR